MLPCSPRIAERCAGTERIWALNAVADEGLARVRIERFASVKSVATEHGRRPPFPSLGTRRALLRGR